MEWDFIAEWFNRPKKEFNVPNVYCKGLVGHFKWGNSVYYGISYGDFNTFKVSLIACDWNSGKFKPLFSMSKYFNSLREAETYVERLISKRKVFAYPFKNKI